MCEYCEKHKKISLHRAENLNVHDCYMVKADDGTAIIFENVQGMPAYIDANFCFHCGEPLTEAKPLSLDELRERNGKPVYIQMGDGAEFWAIVASDGDSPGGICLYSPDYDEDYPDEDFYAMFFNDPDGHFGLHILGWAAYDRQPQREENV